MRQIIAAILKLPGLKYVNNQISSQTLLTSEIITNDTSS